MDSIGLDKGYIMTEKINELIKSVKDLKYDSSTGTFETDRRALFDFAELIVRECIEQCVHTNHNNQWDKGIAWAVGQIKQHFGVEE